MAYIDQTNLQSLPIMPGYKGPEPASILFNNGPQWTRRYQRTRETDRLRNRFMYQDQGPPLYQLRGAHYNMYATPNRTDCGDFSRSFYYEPRQYNAPMYRNGCVAFPPGPPPAQVARFNDLLPPISRSAQVKSLHTPHIQDPAPSIKGWDKYRYLPGPPAQAAVYGSPQGWEVGVPTLC